MYQMKNKIFAIGIVTLFLVLTIAPTINALNSTTSSQATIFEKQKNQQQTIGQPNKLQQQIQSVMSRLRDTKDTFIDINEIIDWLMNNTENPFIALLLSRLISMSQFENKEIILSMGWDYDMNPFKKMETKLIKPFTFWMYSDGTDFMDIPSSTFILAGEPMTVKMVSGNQIGFMYRFRGIYGHIPNSIPNKSFTYMIGYAQNIGTIDLPELN